jgi:hypothetical protein
MFYFVYCWSSSSPFNCFDYDGLTMHTKMPKVITQLPKEKKNHGYYYPSLKLWMNKEDNYCDEIFFYGNSFKGKITFTFLKIFLNNTSTPYNF